MSEIEEGIRRYSTFFSKFLGACPDPCPVEADPKFAEDGDEWGRSETRGDL